MASRFDELAKSIAAGMSRREALKRLGGGLAVALLSSVGLGKAWADGGNGGNSDCAHWCVANFPPGPARGACISQAAHGTGPCYDCGPAGNNTGLCGGVCCHDGTVCVGGQCVNPSCGSFRCGGGIIDCTGNLTCFCFTSAEGPGICGLNAFCNQLQHCNTTADCPGGTFCAINTCCGVGVCISRCGDGQGPVVPPGPGTALG